MRCLTIPRPNPGKRNWNTSRQRRHLGQSRPGSYRAGRRDGNCSCTAAIKTREVKGSSFDNGPTFRYAKLLSTNFFGTGLVDVPPGGIKRPKNSRKMQMSFFVVKGRVTVTVGPLGGQETGRMNRFSIGKGGFWQVPRGESPTYLRSDKIN